MAPSTAASELQQKLLKRMGIDIPESSAPRRGQNYIRKNNERRPSTQAQSRKLQRKAQRVQKKGDRYAGGGGAGSVQKSTQMIVRGGEKGFQKQNIRQKAPVTRKEVEPEDNISDDDKDESLGDSDAIDEDAFSDEDEEMSDGLEALAGEGEDDDGSGLEDEPDESDESDEDFENEKSLSRPDNYDKLPKAVRDKIAEDDAEIKELERKLGIKKGRASLPQAFKDDGLDELMGELGEAGEDGEGSEHNESSKRKHEFDDWLASKRRKANSGGSMPQDEEDDQDLDPSDDEFDDMMEDEEDFDEGSFDGFDSDDEGRKQQPKQKENPYVAPTTGNVAKYVPPSLRKATSSESEAKTRLRKQVQGLINRLTEANILSIVQSMEELYQKNARGDVTELLTGIILAQMQKPDSVPDQFFVLTGGFSAAIYKIVGSSFGSHLIREIVREFGEAYDKSNKDEGDPSAIPKEASNMMGFLTQLYLFEVISCKLVFDYLERLLEDLSELNVEILLRICRMAGRQLRKDDPQALKHITNILNKAVTKVGYNKISARTRFMIETINDLKNSKPKARGMDSTIVSEHVQRMRKRLGELKSQTRRLDGLAAMGVSLNDLEKADTLGKWWLVGASVPVKEGKLESKGSLEEGTKAVVSDNEDMDFVLPDYPKKARAQGFNTKAQVAIFTALMSAMNYEHGYQQYLGLGLKRDDQLEIARVLVQCVGSETQYNEYYALVAEKACTNNKVRFAFQNRLWRIFRSLGESMFGEDGEEEETAESERMKDKRRIGHVARFYASLIIDGALSITVLKPLNIMEANSWTLLFVEWLMVSLLRACRGKGPKESSRVDKVFSPAADLPSLSAGLQWFLRKKFHKTKVITGQEEKKLEKVKERALAVIQSQISLDE